MSKTAAAIVLFIAGILCFLLAVFKVEAPVELVALGLAFMVGGFVVERV